MRTVRKTHGRIYMNPTRSSLFQFSTLFILCLGLFILGCQKESDLQNSIEKISTSPLIEPNAVSPLSDVQALLLSGFEVQYEGRSYSGGKTTFCYSATGSGQLSFEVELPDCAGTPNSYSPKNPTIDNSGGTPAAEWHPPTSSSQATYTFCVTYNGNIKEGLVLVTVFNGSSTETELFPGACARVFNISGRLFADANANGQPDNEAGIDGKEVFLLDSDGSQVASTTTDDGDYLFECIIQGDYTVKVISDDITGTTNSTYIQATTPTEIDVTIGPDQNNVNFGFETKTELLTDEMKSGSLKTNALSVNYWKGQFQKALSGRPDDFTIAELKGLISDINGFGLSDPFKFSSGDAGVQQVYDILRTKPSKDIDALRSELLANELNHFDDRGFLNVDGDLQEVMILYLEGVLANAVAGSASSLTLKSSTTAAATSTTTLSRSIDMSRTFNSGGGGGDH
ncbi:MAG: hypothetical protein OEM26_04180 [Saprospiraceae bacterium]|nr:hypothetical protein [Saprospiraceae bacterium]